MTSSDTGAPPPQGTGDPAPPTRATTPPEAKTSWTLSQLLQWTVQRFTEVGLDSPRIDAEHLLAHALQCARVDLYVRFDMVVGSDERTRFRELVRRRLAREPVAYIEGKRGFHALNLELCVDRRVLVPRPETELLVDWLLETLPQADGVTVLDVGTGSGAIALSVKRARPDVRVVASDVSADALDVARANAVQCELDVEFVQADLFDGVATPEHGWTAIVSNPPYIDTEVLAGLSPDVREWEPTLALDGGPDGLDVVRRLVAEAPARLSDAGLFGLEIGFDQGPRVVALAQSAGLVEVHSRRDLAGHDRMVLARKAGQKLGEPAAG